LVELIGEKNEDRKSRANVPLMISFCFWPWINIWVLKSCAWVCIVWSKRRSKILWHCTFKAFIF
jgi:hypothetical protein